ncbi:MAG TPA: HAD hydrolase-like protein [Candidatus Saccharimonadales bacterium]|nr:HAD hydrolase-like protein [Candidatus Saccharimonadales bacterium]
MSLAERRLPAYLEGVECYPKVVDVPLKIWHEESGTRCLLVDMDDTVIPYRPKDQQTGEVPEDVVQFFAEGRARGWYDRLGIVTNSHKLNIIKSVVSQLKAEDFFRPRPLRFGERKPFKTLIGRALAEFDVEPQNASMIGDKLPMDILAARWAGLGRIAWVEPLGGSENGASRLLRRFEQPRRELIETTTMAIRGK